MFFKALDPGLGRAKEAWQHVQDHFIMLQAEPTFSTSLRESCDEEKTVEARVFHGLLSYY
jgi:hypothetical protein